MKLDELTKKQLWLFNMYVYMYVQCITKVSTPLTFLQIFKYISSWGNTDKMTLTQWKVVCVQLI